MLALAADENFNNDIVRGLLRRKPDLNIARLQDVGLSGADDSTVLEWAAEEGRVLLTHDASTITHYAYERVRARSWDEIPHTRQSPNGPGRSDSTNTGRSFPGDRSGCGNLSRTI